MIFIAMTPDVTETNKSPRTGSWKLPSGSKKTENEGPIKNEKNQDSEVC